MQITEVRTLNLADGPAPALTFVQLVSDEGVVGLGETYYTPQSVDAYVHEVLAPAILGKDVTRDGWNWEQVYGESARRVPGGVDLRAQSAVDLAVWDLRGKAAGRPVSDLLGAARGDGVKVYNTCAGSTYASATSVSRGVSAEHDDLWRAVNEPGNLAAELVAAGFSGMKLWPFDAAARVDNGRSIRAEDLAEGVGRIAAIREAVGDDIEIMVEGHGLWFPTAAARILNALEHLDITWAEDMILAHDPQAIGHLSRMTNVPLAASEYVGSRWSYRQLLEQGAAGYLHLDPSWCGGITEAQNILSLASSYGVLAAMHDCTGPMNLLAGLHLARANPIVGYQEVLRAFLSDVYPTMVDTHWSVDGGRMSAPDRPGLGAELLDEFVTAATVRCSS